jgi:diguanylate cyclase
MIKPDQTQIDDLTRLYNRKAFQERFSGVLVNAKASSQEIPLSLALLDVDIFNKINEEYGHGTGDNVLILVAEAIQAHAGKDALAGRYGGDEFVIVFPGEEREKAFLKVERIRQELSQHQIASTDGKSINGIFISGGVASFPMDGRTENELFRKADHALYRAKTSGRKQIRLAYEERMVPKTTHYTQTQLERLSKLAEERLVSEADLLREQWTIFLPSMG